MPTRKLQQVQQSVLICRQSAFAMNFTLVELDTRALLRLWFRCSQLPGQKLTERGKPATAGAWLQEGIDSH